MNGFFFFFFFDMDGFRVLEQATLVVPFHPKKNLNILGQSCRRSRKRSSFYLQCKASTADVICLLY